MMICSGGPNYVGDKNKRVRITTADGVFIERVFGAYETLYRIFHPESPEFPIIQELYLPPPVESIVSEEKLGVLWWKRIACALANKIYG
ncbi:hypothetical protein [Paenibacillus marchantiophytorum]|uniref:hypothetical protein n=1 Tax=Paenibacillus marchantiophytorum TaxID=1619310 RepID=UPI001662CE04|nr:hypothetical protein [Paenibacillus marchantiophytorum]